MTQVASVELPVTVAELPLEAAVMAAMVVAVTLAFTVAAAVAATQLTAAVVHTAAVASADMAVATVVVLADTVADLAGMVAEVLPSVQAAILAATSVLQHLHREVAAAELVVADRVCTLAGWLVFDTSVSTRASALPSTDWIHWYQTLVFRHCNTLSMPRTIWLVFSLV